MKKNYILSLCIMLFSAINTFAFEGGGTQEDPYKISNAQDLIDLAATQIDAETYAGKYFVMTADIDMKDLNNFGPIGDNFRPFKGNFDGKDFKIKNLVIPRGKSEDDYSALFGVVEDGTIQNVHIAGASWIEGNNYVAGIAAYIIGGKVISCSSSATVMGNNSYSLCVAGIVGNAFNSEIKDCINYGYINATGINVQDVGGIAGSLTSGASISGSTNFGTISGVSNVGGICGYVGSTETIRDCINEGFVTGTKEYVGGIAGYTTTGLLTTSSIYKCHNTADVSGKDYVGGIAGRSTNTEACGNVGNVKSTGKYAGGVAGAGYAEKSYNRGEISGVDAVGGVVGNLSSLNNCYNIGNVKGESNIGGIAGQMAGTENQLLNSYSAGQISLTTGNTNSQGGIAGNVNTGGFVNGNKIANSYWNNDLYPLKGVGNLENISTGKFEYYPKSTSELNASGFPAILGNAWAQDTEDRNNGYPILTEAEGTAPLSKNRLYNINVHAGDNGSVLPIGEVLTGVSSAVVIKITPDEGYEIDQILANAQKVKNVEYYAFEDIDHGYSLVVSFKEEGGNSIDEIKPDILFSQTVFTDILEIKGAEKYNLQITDIAGKVFYSKQSISADESIQTSSFPQGIYLIILEKGSDIQTFKVIKK